MRLIAHRGASGLAPENTLAAFKLALGMKAGAVELDVHQTASKDLVVIHDEDLRRVAGRCEQIRDMSWQELCRFDVGSWFDARFFEERVPRLEEVLALLKGKCEIHLELKRGSGFYPGIEQRVLELVRKNKVLKTCVVSSFDHKALHVSRALEPKLRLGYLLGESSLEEAWVEMKDLRAESLNLSRRQVDPRRVATAHRRKLKVLVYTVNEKSEFDKFLKMGVDGVFSNYPDLAQREK